MGISQASRAARALPWNQAWKLYKPFNESDTSLEPAFLVPLFSSYELVVKRPCERCVNYAVQSQTPSVCRVSKLCKRPAAVIFFFLKGREWAGDVKEKSQKKGGGAGSGRTKVRFQRIPEEASRELTGEGRKVCVCVDGKARQDLNSESLELWTSV